MQIKISKTGGKGIFSTDELGCDVDNNNHCGELWLELGQKFGMVTNK